MPGAVLSVPLLTITKILLSHANHPLATYALMLIRCAEAPLEPRCSSFRALASSPESSPESSSAGDNAVNLS